MGRGVGDFLIQQLIHNVVFLLGTWCRSPGQTVRRQRRRRAPVRDYLCVFAVSSRARDSSSNPGHLLGAVRDLFLRSLSDRWEVDRPRWACIFLHTFFPFWSLHRLFLSHCAADLSPCGSLDTANQAPAKTITGSEWS